MTMRPRPRGGPLVWLAALATLAVGGCMGDYFGGGKPSASSAPPPQIPVQTAQGQASGPNIGSGPIRIALILPLSGSGQGAAAAASLRNAAELAMAESQGSELTILVKDDRGTADGAREATSQALADGAELILGPLFAPAVQAAGQVAKAAGKPVIAFSTDTSVASRGVYLLSFTVQPEVDRVIGYAASQGRRSLAALVPESVYGNVVEAEFRESAARRGLRVVGVERYAPGQPGPAVQRLASVIGGASPTADALLLPESGDGLAGLGQALTEAGFNPARVKPLGTGVWNDPRTVRVAALAGGWYAVPDQTGFQGFSTRYRARYGGEPARIATLAYDAISLANAFSRAPPGQRFQDSAILSPAGFAGADGAFRFRPDGTNDRTLAVVEIRGGTTAIVSPAPKTLGAGGT